MLGQIVAAEWELERIAAELKKAGGSGVIDQERSRLSHLLRRVDGAGASALTSLRTEIGAAIAEARSVAEQSRTSATSAEVAEGASLAIADRVARQQVQSFHHDFYERKIFDPYLRFSSKEDEEEYRRREDANRRAIEAALAKHTPEGDLEAIRLTERQMADAGAHGADASPEFAPMLARLDHARSNLEAAKRPEPERAAKAKTAQDGGGSAGSLDAVLATLKAAGVETLAQPASGAGHGLGPTARISRDPDLTGRA